MKTKKLRRTCWHRLEVAASSKSIAAEHSERKEEQARERYSLAQASIAYFRASRGVLVSTGHECTRHKARHNWWVLYLMIMATIMMIGMALMALKMKIACSRFLCAFCVPAWHWPLVSLSVYVFVWVACCVCVRGGRNLCAIFCCFICSHRMRWEWVATTTTTLSAFDFITLIYMYVKRDKHGSRTNQQVKQNIKKEEKLNIEKF